MGGARGRNEAETRRWANLHYCITNCWKYIDIGVSIKVLLILESFSLRSGYTLEDPLVLDNYTFVERL